VLAVALGVWWAQRGSTIAPATVFAVVT